MERTIIGNHLRARRVTTGLLGVAALLVAAGVLVGGCGSADSSAPDATGPGAAPRTSAAPTTMPELPPMDLRAPADFETASFALG